MSKKKIIISILAVLLIFIVSISIYFIINKNITNVSIKDNFENKIDLGSKFEEKRKFEDLDVEDTKIVDNKGNILFRARFVNNTENTIKSYNAVLSFIDKDGNTISKTKFDITSIEKGESRRITLLVDDVNNIKDIYDFKLEKK